MSALPRPEPRPGVLDIDAYVPGKSTAPGVARIFKLSSNESPLGASPEAVAAFRDASDTPHPYPDGAASRLRPAIADRHGLHGPCAERSSERDACIRNEDGALPGVAVWLQVVDPVHLREVAVGRRRFVCLARLWMPSHREAPRGRQLTPAAAARGHRAGRTRCPTRR